MDSTVSLLAKVLGAKGLEGSGPDARFVVESPDGGRLKVSVVGRSQRLMAALIDANGITRASVDVGPVAHVKADPGFPGRVTLHVGKLLIHLDSEPSLAIEILTADE